ncbi:uncharacterized protein EI97DRAFT_114707 [Westerdykella ornata]|uniref:Uncharacterized protein n=1 Tax=Westerdykella ornata TaxID=318751 RepID=A0A6A6JYU4_WESOR|nr:uncharacterized protein EI97DRAFT_114707 [Westerdykella ornata]KAF2280209.1 hypothetical protein EI97DRAFT_114707 [Westerdykella ornata]
MFVPYNHVGSLLLPGIRLAESISPPRIYEALAEPWVQPTRQLEVPWPFPMPFRTAYDRNLDGRGWLVKLSPGPVVPKLADHRLSVCSTKEAPAPVTMDIYKIPSLHYSTRVWLPCLRNGRLHPYFKFFFPSEASFLSFWHRVGLKPSLTHPHFSRFSPHQCPILSS